LSCLRQYTTGITQHIYARKNNHVIFHYQTNIHLLSHEEIIRYFWAKYTQNKATMKKWSVCDSKSDIAQQYNTAMTFLARRGFYTNACILRHYFVSFFIVHYSSIKLYQQAMKCAIIYVVCTVVFSLNICVFRNFRLRKY